MIELRNAINDIIVCLEKNVGEILTKHARQRKALEKTSISETVSVRTKDGKLEPLNEKELATIL